MFALLLLICAGLFGSLHFGETTTTGADSSPTAAVIAKCDNGILEKITEKQCPMGRPGYLIDTAAQNGIENVLYTSTGYYAVNVKCVSSEFIPNEDYSNATVIINFVYNDNSTSQKNITLTENCGSTYDPASNIRRIHIWYYRGVTVVYVCSEDESATTGPPSFFIKCASHQCATETVKSAAEVMKSIGYNASKDYTTCK